MARGSNRAGPVDCPRRRRWRSPGRPADARPGPWRARQPSVPSRSPAHQLRSVATWPAEPVTPAEIDAERFHAAFARLCVVDPDGAVADLAEGVLAAARAQELDPFELAALAFTASGCNPKYQKRPGVGLLAIDAAMYRASDGPALDPELRRSLTTKQLLDPATNLAVGAKLLRMWRETHLASDEAFGGVPHRDAVSHFMMGRRGAQQRPRGSRADGAPAHARRVRGRRRRRARDARRDRHGLAARGAAPRGDQRPGRRARRRRRAPAPRPRSRHGHDRGARACARGRRRRAVRGRQRPRAIPRTGGIPALAHQRCYAHRRLGVGGIYPSASITRAASARS